LTAGSALGSLLAVAAGPGALFWTAAGLRLFSVSRRFPRLPDIPAEKPAGGWPRVSVIVPARNEERSLEAAARALLALDDPALEVSWAWGPSTS